MAVKIFTDASSNLFKKILEEKNLDIKVLPMTLDLGDKKYVCYEDDIDVEAMSKEFYEKMKNGLRPKTSLMSPGVFLEEAEREIENGNDVIFVTLAGGISGTYNSAVMIADQINDDYDRPRVRVINSKTAGFGEALVAIKACRLSMENKSLDEIYEETLKYVEIVRSEFTVDNIMYLAQTGRVTKLVAAIANVLSIKVLLYGSSEGKIEDTGKVRGKKHAIKTLASQVIEYNSSKDQTIYIAHCDAYDDANSLKEQLNQAGFNNVEIYYYDLITGAHVGPGCVAVFYEGYTREMEKKSIISKVFGKNEK